MIAAAALALALAAQDPLAGARAALTSGDLALAERLALAAAVPPDEAAALYLAGVARFRAGRPAEALELFDRAGPAGDAPGPWSYNRGACLLDLERPEEAERAFVAAAQADRSLAAVALVNAGFAALDAGAIERAREHAAAARRAAEGPGADLVRDLERGVAEAAAARAAGEYAAGLDAFDRGDFVEARRRFLAAAELAPADGKSRLMAGASALRRGEREAGDADVHRALELGLAAEDARIALAYLERPAAAGAWSALARAEGGWDSNALQTGAGAGNDRFAQATGVTSSAFAAAELAVGWGGSVGGRRLDVGYDLSQLAYQAVDARDYAVQQHALVAALELAPRGKLRLGAGADAQLAFAGLSAFRALLGSAGLRGWAAYDETARTATRLDFGAWVQDGRSEFGYLGGARLEAGLSQELRLARFALRGGYRLRLDDLGEDRAAVAPPPLQACEMMACTAELRATFGHLAQLGWAAARFEPVPRLALDLSVGAERRSYLRDDRFSVRQGGRELAGYAERRHDWRLTAGAAVTVRLGERLSLTGRWDHVTNRSTLGARRDDCNAEHCPPSPLGDHGYTKDVLSAGLSLAW